MRERARGICPQVQGGAGRYDVPRTRAGLELLDAVVLLGVDRGGAGRDGHQRLELLRRRRELRRGGGGVAGRLLHLRNALVHRADVRSQSVEEAIAAYRKALEPRPAFPLARNNVDAAERQLDLKKSERERQQAPAGR